MRKTCESCGVEFEGSSQARYHSDACRKAHARAQARGVDPTLPARDVNEMQSRLALEPPEKVLQRPELSITLEQYVKQIRREAAAYSDSIGETDAPYKVSEQVIVSNRKRDRMARAEAYARWRYAGFLSGEVASL